MADALMKQLTGKQTGGDKMIKRNGADVSVPDDYELQPGDDEYVASGGRRHRRHSKGHKGNSWLAHVKATMKLHPGKSFKQILKIAKKTYKKSQSQSQSQSQSGGRRRKPQNQKSQKSQKKYQNGGSGGKMAGLGESAAPYV
jgi:hypothetical protein